MLNFPRLSFRLLSKQRRKVRIYIILELHLRKKFTAPLPLLINPSFWNSKTQRVISSHVSSNEINRKLKILQDQFTKNYDLENIKSLGVNTYRFSIEWSRIFPEENHATSMPECSPAHKILHKQNSRHQIILTFSSYYRHHGFYLGLGRQFVWSSPPTNH